MLENPEPRCRMTTRPPSMFDDRTCRHCKRQERGRRACRRLRALLLSHQVHAKRAPKYPITAADTAIDSTPTAIGPEAWWIQNRSLLSSLEKRSAAPGFRRLAS